MQEQQEQQMQAQQQMGGMPNEMQSMQYGNAGIQGAVNNGQPIQNDIQMP